MFLEYTWSENLVSVIHSSSCVEDPLLSKPGVKHVLAEDPAPHVPVVASIITNYNETNRFCLFVFSVDLRRCPKLAPLLVPSILSIPKNSL